MKKWIPTLHEEYHKLDYLRRSNRRFAVLYFAIFAYTAVPAFSLAAPSISFYSAAMLTMSSMFGGLAYYQSRRQGQIKKINDLVEQDVNNPEIDELINKAFGTNAYKRKAALQHSHLLRAPPTPLPTSGRDLAFRAFRPDDIIAVYDKPSYDPEPNDESPDPPPSSHTPKSKFKPYKP